MHQKTKIGIIILIVFIGIIGAYFGYNNYLQSKYTENTKLQQYNMVQAQSYIDDAFYIFKSNYF